MYFVKNNRIIILTLLMTPFFSLFADIPEPYRSVKVLPFDPYSMFAKVCSDNLEHLIKEHEVKTVIEVGCWLGASTRAIAKFLPEDGKVYAVDHWKGSEEHQIQHTLRHKDRLPILYEQFLSNVIHEGLTHKIIPIRKSSLEASKSLTCVPDLIFIDASHDEKNVYEDLEAWYPFIQGHGILCGDDYTREGVKKAVKRFAVQNGLTIQEHGRFWLLLER